MGDLFALGFPAALALKCLGLTLAGALAGMVLGAMLGIGPGLVLLVAPLLGGDASGTLAAAAGLYYGAQYGRSLSAILLGVPGGPSSVVTVIDGHAMAEQGRAEAALSATLLSGFFACTVATALVSILAGPLGNVALLLGPAEMCAIFLFSLALAIAFTGEALPKTLVMALLGLALAYLDARLQSGAVPAAFGAGYFENGLNAYAVVIGLIGLSAAFVQISERGSLTQKAPASVQPLAMRPELAQAISPGLRGSVIGAVLGLLPVGGLIAPFCAYRLERWLAKDATRFGSGAIEGVAAPEAANNAAAQAALLPMLALGLQFNAVLALAVGSLVMAKAVPGPNIQSTAPSLYWGTIAAFWIASLMVLVLGLATLKIWPKLLRLPRVGVLVALVLLGCLWTFSINTSIADVLLALAMGGIAWLLVRRGFEPVPAVIGFLLGQQIAPQLENALMISRGSYWALVQRPIGAVLVGAGLCVVIAAALRGWTGRQQAATRARG